VLTYDSGHILSEEFNQNVYSNRKTWSRKFGNVEPKLISVGAQSTSGGGGQDIFARKYMHKKLTKLIKCQNFA